MVWQRVASTLQVEIVRTATISILILSKANFVPVNAYMDSEETALFKSSNGGGRNEIIGSIQRWMDDSVSQCLAVNRAMINIATNSDEN